MSVATTKYRPRVVVEPIEAVEINQDNIYAVAQWVEGKVLEEFKNGEVIPFIHVQNANHEFRADISDVMIKKPHQEFTAMHSSIFDRKFEEVAN